MGRALLFGVLLALPRAAAAAQVLEPFIPRGFAPPPVADILQGARRLKEAGALPDSPEIQAARYDQAALRQCGRHTQAAFFNECLAVIRDRTFDPAALGACDRHNYPDSLNACLRIAADGRYQASAVELCNRHQFAAPLNLCLALVRERTYTGEELNLCGRHLYSDGLNRCLEVTGEPMPREEPAG